MNRRKKYTIEEVKKFAIEEKNGLCLSDVYIHNKSNLRWKCGYCNHIFYNSFKNVKYLGNWCPSCSGKLNNNIENIQKLALKKGGWCLSEKYINNKTNLLWKCGKCLHIWNARLDRVKSGTWCPKCNQSYGERKISENLGNKSINYKQEFIFGKLKNRRFDFYIEKYNLLIEFDGIQHFEIYGRYAPNEKTLKKIQLHDIEKTLFCIKNNIKLLRICYKDLKYIDFFIKKSLISDIKLIFSDWKLYNYIIDKIGNTMFLTGIGEK